MPPYVLAMAMEDSSNAKTPDTETPPQPHPTITKSISFTTNGSLKRHHHHPPQPVVLLYKECLKNHAANIGGLALDGCGEFMPSPTATQADPTSLKCAACGCHRNFHRRELDESSGAAHFISFHQPQRLPPPLNMSLTPSPSASPGQSPPPPAVAPYSSAPHMLLALSNGFPAPADDYHHQNQRQNHHQQALNPVNRENPSGRKRFRTKFSQTQKEKMQSFAEKLGWKLHKSDERLVEEFCNEVGVRRGVLKVWMHNNKHNIAKRDHHQIGNNTNNNNNNNSSSHGNGLNHDDQRNGNVNGSGSGSGNNSRASFDTDAYNTNTDTENHQNEGNSAHLHLSTNGSSSSS